MARRKQREPAPPEQLRALAASLEGDAALASGYLLRGEERYFRDRALELLNTRARGMGWDHAMHDARDPDFDLGILLADLTGGSLFGAERLIVVRAVDKARLLEGGARNPSPLTRALVARLESDTASGGSLVLSVDSLRADHMVAKAITKAGGTLLTCRRLWDSPPPWDPDPTNTELAQWTRARASELGVRLDPRQAAYVAAATGNDLAAIEDKLTKLRTTGPSGLREVVGWESGGAPFALADELLGADPARALAGIESLFRGGFADRGGRRVIDAPALSIMLLSSLVKGARSSLAVARGLAAGEAGAGLLESVGFKGPPRAGEALVARARSVSAANWSRRLEEALALERQLKTGVAIDASSLALLALRWAEDRPEKTRQLHGSR